MKPLHLSTLLIITMSACDGGTPEVEPGNRHQGSSVTMDASSVQHRVGDPARPKPRVSQGWILRHQNLSDQVRDTDREPRLDVFFLGDSITEYWLLEGENVWRSEFKGMRVFNSGISGDTTHNILYRITHGAFENITPKVVVLLAGINNLGMYPDTKPEEVARGLEGIIAVLREKSPESKILLVSILPTAGGTKRIMEVNKRLASLQDNSTVYFLDIFEAFLDSNGRLDPRLTTDGLHLSADGYRVWANEMRPVLKKVLDAADQ